MKLKPAVIEEIYFSKRIYIDAQNYLLPTADKYDFSFGLLLIQDAIELLLGAVVLQCGLSLKPNAGINDYFNKIESELNVKVLYKKEIEKINRARVDIKHHGILKKFDDYKNEVAFLPYFFEELSFKAFGLNFNQISLADVIESAKIKEKILDAENALTEKRYKDCVEKLAWARHEIIGNRFIAAGPVYDAFGITTKSKNDVTFENYLDTSASVIILQYGIDSAKFGYYSSILPEVYYSHQNKKFELNWYTTYCHENNWSEILLRKALDYFIEIAVKIPWNSIYSDLKIDSHCYKVIIKPKGDVLNFYSYSLLRNIVNELFSGQVIHTISKGQELVVDRINISREKQGEYIVISDVFKTHVASFLATDAEIVRMPIEQRGRM